MGEDGREDDRSTWRLSAVEPAQSPGHDSHLDKGPFLATKGPPLSLLQESLLSRPVVGTRERNRR